MVAQVYTGQQYPVGNLGTIGFKIVGQIAPPNSVQDGMSLKEFKSIQWTNLYSTPDGADENSINLEISLNQPCRQDCESIIFDIDCSTLETRVLIDGDEADLEDLSLPKELILALRDQMVGLGSDYLDIFYHGESSQEDCTRKIHVNFEMCRAIGNPITFLSEFAENLNQTLS